MALFPTAYGMSMLLQGLDRIQSLVEYALYVVLQVWSLIASATLETGCIPTPTTGFFVILYVVRLGDTYHVGIFISFAC